MIPESPAVLNSSNAGIPVILDRRGDGPSYLPQLQRDILQVIRKYVAIDNDAVSVSVEQDGAHEVLELNIVLPD